VLCEKPLAETTPECDDLIAAASAYHTTLSVNNTRRLIPATQLVKEALLRGGIGEPLSLRYVEGIAFGWPTLTGFYFGRHSH
jgi:predicted dehydrogenase